MKNTYIALLRGINVSGSKMIKMPELKAVFASLGFSSITTYLQSGNVVFESELSDAFCLKQQIETAISEHFKFDVPVILRNAAQIQAIAISNPYLLVQQTDINQLYVTFLSRETSPEGIEKLNLVASGEDSFQIQGEEIYIHCPTGYGRTKINNNLFENKLNVVATTRNWKTVQELLRLSSPLP